jgi:hypothetical protein
VTDFGEAALAIARRAYARQMLAVAGAEDAALEEAFATVPRSDPVLAYQDVLFALAPERGWFAGDGFSLCYDPPPEPEGGRG